MKSTHVLTVCVAVLAVGAASGVGLFWHARARARSLAIENARPDIARKVFGSQKTLDIFLAASEFTAERLRYRLDRRGSPLQLDSYERDVPVPLSPERARSFQAIFTQETTYGWTIGKLCAPNYGVLLTAKSGKDVVRIALCFDCYILGVYDSANDAARPINSENDFMTHELAALVKEIFPNDMDIQKLK